MKKQGLGIRKQGRDQDEFIEIGAVLFGLKRSRERSF